MTTSGITRTLDSRTGARRATGRFERTRYWYRSLPLLAVVCLGSLAYLVWWAYDVYVTNPRGFEDLDAYRLGVQAWWQGHDMYGTLPRTGFGTELAFIYPPFAAMVFSPLVAMSWPAMIISMLLISLVSLAVVSYLAVRRVWPGGGIRGALLAIAVLLPCSVAAEPIYDTLWFGQINLLLMLLVALDCLVARPRWPRGLLIGIAAAIKLTPAVFLLFFLLRKDFRTSATIVLTAAAASVLGFVATWSRSVEFWFGSGGPRTISATGFIGNQSIAGGLARWRLPQSEQQWLWLALCAVAGVFAVLGIVRAHRMGDAVLAMSVTAGFGLLISPVSWSHHWVYLVPAFVAMLAIGVRRRHPGWLLATVGLAVVVTLPPFLHTENGGYVLTLSQQLKANGFTVAGLVLLVAFATPEIVRLTRQRSLRGRP